MKITIDELLKKSFVLTSSREGLNKFDNYFKSCGFNLLPIPFFGRYVPRNSDEFKYNKHWIAAHMSHFEICENAMLNKMNFVCIFEEDIIISKNAIETLEQILNNIPDDAYILRLGYAPYRGYEEHRKFSEKIECVLNDNYINNDYSGSHAYIIFDKFYEYNNRMLYNYRNVLVNYKDIRPIHNQMHYTKQQLDKIWFYEWMMNPRFYRNDLQKHVYTINSEYCLFTQQGYIYNKQDAYNNFIME